MTQIVLVSHSEKIAQGTKDLLEQMAPGVSVVAIGGHDGGIGTSFDTIFTTIESLEDDAVCFFDIGSSEMNLDMALEMYAGSHRVEKITAPIVEGSFIAAVSISTGNDMDAVIQAVNTEF
ncbi:MULTISPECIES: dihydroxyacetone kinase phosphoryl donor subunit DhaM [unclassified Staphylococcus]|uniref:dihydroxyacetone kinase phosphoryl donor subunit DhaM n=1 Tax=unclassified Staphylococcus TaxID=91994 RepID=UPI0021D35B2D|nr:MULTISPECIES: dihydroxyacetone kinase phosphoryl donor subunit DhaM [unclassified Staphylococcus]UXR78217.1 PTS-dependent dihydroxyacetone kinase phosphotransferase subunit DhaM [Staphylococcus sp. IVB6227]UXR82381.1 PTS-dependent dihydroxyacetone kinase phosphotransferase subunit DhaM [Staphylococcus sp. IVB6214]